MRMKARIERIEKEVFPAQARPLVIIPVLYEQTAEQAQAEYCQDQGVEASECAWIFVQRFYGAPTAVIPKPMDRQDEIASILDDLKADGFTEADVARMVRAENEKMGSVNPPKQPNFNESNKRKLLEVKPVSFDVAGLSSRRRR